MPPTPTATVSYKKKDGTLTISADQKYVFFTHTTPPGASPAVTIPVADITNLQQTPEKSAKVALKILVKDGDYTFYFTSKDNARKEQEAVTDTLRNKIAANKAGSASQLLASSSAATPTAAGQQDVGDAGQSAAMAIAKAVSSKAADEGWYDDNKLKSDTQLHKSLLDADKALKARFQQALKDKPESVSIPQFTTQFWSARLHLLRAHAIEKAQEHAQYNVLPEIRFTRIAGEKEGDPDIKRLNITKEQINLIFKQYPVVREAYNENVPPMDSKQFWTRFFGSRLLKKLKGEKIMQQDPPDSVLDKYLDRREGRPASLVQIPHFIDLEGNEQNHSQRLGNRPDEDMRPSSYEKVPILRVLNNLSEKMLSHVAAEDGEAHQPIGMDEEAFEQLRLRDLAMDEEDHRVRLNVREQQQNYLGGDEDDLSAEAKLYARQDPAKVLSNIRSDLQPSHLGSDKNGTLRLDRVIGYHSGSDSDSDDEPDNHQVNGTGASKSHRKRTPIGSHSAMTSATSSILSSIKQRRTASSTDPSSLSGLTQSTFDQLAITHNTTIEFLHYFWTLFLSGDSSRTAELAQLVSTLDKSLDRINAVAETAEVDRTKKIEALKKQVDDYYQRTGKRRKLDLEAVGGGKVVVDAMIRPAVEALRRAGEAYGREFEVQSRDASAMVS